MHRWLCFVVLPFLLAACATGKDRRQGDPWPLGSLVAINGGATEGPHYEIETRFSRLDAAGGGSIAEPALAAAPGESVSVIVANLVEFVQDYDVEVDGDGCVADPIIGNLRDGLRLDLAAAPDATVEGTAWVAYHVVSSDTSLPMRTRDVLGSREPQAATVRQPRGDVAAAAAIRRLAQAGRVQLPHTAVADEAGVRQLRLGTETLLATIAAPDGPGRIAVHARLVAVGDVRSVTWQPPAPEPVSEEDDSQRLGMALSNRPVGALLADAVGGKAGSKSLHVEIIKTPRDLPGLTPLSASRALSLLGGTGRVTHRFELTSASVAGVLAQSLRQTSYVQDFDGKSPPGAAKEAGKQQPLVFDPLIGIIQDGVSVGLIEHEGRPHLQLIWAEIVAPMQEFETTLGGAGRTVSIELPELRLAAVRIDMTTGKVHSGVDGLEPPMDAKIDLTAGRVLLPIGRYLRRDGQADAMGWIGAWIELRDRE